MYLYSMNKCMDYKKTKPEEFEHTRAIAEFRGKLFEGDWPTLPEMFRVTAARYPERNCFTVFEPDRITLTYAEALKKIETLAQWMIEAGVKKGDRVAVTGKNSPEWAVVYLAAGFAGAVIVPIDNGLHEPEAENLLKASGAKLLFVDEEKYDYFDGKAAELGVTVRALNKKHPETYVYNLEPSAPYKQTIDNTPSGDDLCAILFTSGTTGNPKGVMLSHSNLVIDCYMIQSHMYIYSTDVFYALLPIHHAYTMLAVFIEACSVGAELVFGKSMAVSKMLKELKEGKITMLLGVPLLFNKLLTGIMKGIRAKGVVVYGLMRFLMGFSYITKKVTGHNPGKKMFKAVLEKASLGSLRIAICGGGPLAPSIFKIYNEMGVDFVQGYGLTETSPVLALNPIYHFKIASVGKYFPDWMDMRIADPDENGVGEVQVIGPSVMQGYYNMPEETDAVFTEDGWFKTGDLGKLDSEGYLYLAGRAKNLIVTEGGKNVFPEEIENAFQLVDDIEQITVQGYVINEETKSEAVEALVYASDAAYDRLGVKRGTPEGDEAVRAVIQEAVDKVNKTEQPYARITKLTMLEKPLEMTTTKKVKRQYKK